MKRFIDLRGQYTGYRFAWWDTVRDEFESFSGDQAWDTWGEFVEVCSPEAQERYKRLCPMWAFEPRIADDYVVSLSIDLERERKEQAQRIDKLIIQVVRFFPGISRKELSDEVVSLSEMGWHWVQDRIDSLVRLKALCWAPGVGLTKCYYLGKVRLEERVDEEADLTAQFLVNFEKQLTFKFPAPWTYQQIEPKSD